MPKLTIIIQGIALSFLKDGQWNTILPFGSADDCHKVKIAHDVDGPGVPLAEAGRNILVRVTNPNTTTQEGSGFAKFVNLTSPGVSHDTLRFKNGWRDHAALLVMESAVMSQNEPTRCRYFLNEQGGTGSKYLDYVAFSGRAEIDAEAIDIEVSGTGAFSLPIETDTVIMIDNECDQKPTEDTGDLAMFYKYIIEDPQVAGRQFVLERDPRDGGNMMRKASIFEILDTNVRPFFKGLPCNKFIATNLIDELDSEQEEQTSHPRT